jgi:hypothetical protein
VSSVYLRDVLLGLDIRAGQMEPILLNLIDLGFLDVNGDKETRLRLTGEARAFYDLHDTISSHLNDAGEDPELADEIFDEIFL